MPPRPTSDSRQQTGEDFFRHLPDDGAIRLPDGERVAVLSLEFVESLHATLAHDLGDAARHVLYSAGYEWGLQDMVSLTQRMRQELGGDHLDLWQMDAKFVLEAWWAPLAAGGWGACEFDLTTQTKGVTLVELRDSAVAVTQQRARTPVCHLYAGLFAGVISYFERSESHAVEVQCAAMGHPSCRFVIASGAQIDAVESWRQQGAPADEIRRRLA